MGAKWKVSLSEHALKRIRERSSIDPQNVLELINNNAVHEAHRENGVSYLVLWGAKDRRPFLVVVEKAVVISFYYTYELHRRKDNCVILPVHIKLAREAYREFITLQEVPRYRIVVLWEAISVKGLTRPYRRKLLNCSKFEFESFEGTLFEFVAKKGAAIEILSKINTQVGCKVTICVERSDHSIVTSEDLSH